jgi:hypothetical protein
MITAAKRMREQMADALGLELIEMSDDAIVAILTKHLQEGRVVDDSGHKHAADGKFGAGGASPGASSGASSGDAAKGAKKLIAAASTREQYDGMKTVIAKLSPTALQRIDAHTKDVRFYGDRKSLTEELAKVEPKLKDLLAKGSTIGGGYNRRDQSLHLNGYFYSKEEGKIPAATGYAHELTHAIDGPKHEISNSKEWQDAWESEVKSGSLGQYATTKPSEGLAEFGRLVMTGKMNRQEVEKKYPKCSAVWEQHKLWQ